MRKLLVASVLLVASSAVANPRYPEALRRMLELTNAPQCTLCHETASGGDDTATRPFGVAAHDRGLEGDSDDATLQRILDELESENVDSDGDGVGNIAELRDGRDPNVAEPTAQENTPPPDEEGGPTVDPEEGAAGGCAAAGGALPVLMGLLAGLAGRRSARKRQ